MAFRTNGSQSIYCVKMVQWCTNTSQPDIASLLKIADLLEVDIKELIVREYKAYL